MGFFDSILGSSDDPDEDLAEKDQRAPPFPESKVPATAGGIFYLLSNERRRRVIDYLEHQGTASIADLSRYIEYLEGDYDDIVDVDHDDRKAVYVSLYQTHMEILVSHGAVAPLFGNEDGERDPDEKARYQRGPAHDVYHWLLSGARAAADPPEPEEDQDG